VGGSCCCTGRRVRRQPPTSRVIALLDSRHAVRGDDEASISDVHHALPAERSCVLCLKLLHGEPFGVVRPACYCDREVHLGCRLWCLRYSAESHDGLPSLFLGVPAADLRARGGRGSVRAATATAGWHPDDEYDREARPTMPMTRPAVASPPPFCPRSATCLRPIVLKTIARTLSSPYPQHSERTSEATANPLVVTR